MIDLKNNKGEKMGTATFEQKGEALKLNITASGLTPGKHGFHIHQKLIQGNDFETAGSHLNPVGKQHGDLNPKGPHLGDLVSLEVEASGNVNQTFELTV